MAADLMMNSDGLANVMLANNPAWHGMGKVWRGFPTSREIVTEFPDFQKTVVMSRIQNEHGFEIPGFFATHFEDNPRHTFGIVSDRYKPVQMSDGFQLLDSLVENGELKYESAGMLGAGERAWMLGRLPQYDEIAEGDTILRYLFVGMGHDGKTPINIGVIPTRTVCANTFATSVRESAITIRHKGDMRLKLEDAHKYLSQFDEQFTLFRDSGRLLASRKFTPDQAKEYMAKLFPAPLETDGRAATIVANKLEACRRTFQFERNRLPSIRGTWWQLLNSVTDAIDHDPRKNLDTLAKREKQMVNLLEGNGADFKSAAFQLALDMSA